MDMNTTTTRNLIILVSPAQRAHTRQRLLQTSAELAQKAKPHPTLVPHKPQTVNVRGNL